MSKTTDLAERDAKARLRAAFDGDLTHIRAGDWNRLNGAHVGFLGTVRDLHSPTGTCTCCHGRNEPHV